MTVGNLDMIIEGLALINSKSMFGLYILENKTKLKGVPAEIMSSTLEYMYVFIKKPC